MPAYVAFAGAFNTTAGSHNAMTTPAIGDTIIVLGGYTGGTAASGSYTDNQAGGTYTKLASSVKNASADTWELFVRDNLITTTTSHIVTQADPPGADTGGGSGALRCSGFLVGGAATLVQFKVLSNQTVSGVPTVTFDAACSSTSFIVATVFHSVNSTTTFTAPSGMTERTESGYSSPLTSMEICTQDSGFTGTAVTWAAGSATQPWCALIAEFTAGTAPAGLPPRTQARYGW